MSIFSSFPLEDCLAHQTGIMQAAERVLQAGNYILGHEVASFEQEFADYIHARCVIGVANGTDAIELILRGLGIGTGDMVAVPSLTAVASISAISRAGAAPLFVDIDAETATLCPLALEKALRTAPSGRVKAILAVHLYGHPCAMQELQTIADEQQAVLLEDVAQAHGATYQGQPAGSLARASAFSFYPTKNLGAIGDGGAVVTNDESLAERIRSIRQYGWAERYISVIEGINSRLDEVQAGILRVKLPSLPEQLRRRRHLASIYSERLGGCRSVNPPVIREDGEHAYHLYVVRSPCRDELMRHLTAKGIPVARHYPAAVHQQPAYLDAAAQSPPLPITETWIREILTLPLHPYLAEDAVHFVCDAIQKFERQSAR